MNPDAKICFDDAHRPVPAADFDFEAVDRDALIEDLRAAIDYQKTKLPEMLNAIVEALLSDALTAEKLQRSVLFFGYVARRKPFHRQLDLAAFLKITPSALNQQIKIFCEKHPIIIMARLREASDEIESGRET